MYCFFLFFLVVMVMTPSVCLRSLRISTSIKPTSSSTPAGPCSALPGSFSPRHLTSTAPFAAPRLSGGRYVSILHISQLVHNHLTHQNLQSNAHQFIATQAPHPKWLCFVVQTGALLLDGDTLQYFGATVPVNLAAAVIAEVILVGGAEYYRSTNKSPLGSVCAFHHDSACVFTERRHFKKSYVRICLTCYDISVSFHKKFCVKMCLRCCELSVTSYEKSCVQMCLRYCKISATSYNKFLCANAPEMLPLVWDCRIWTGCTPVVHSIPWVWPRTLISLPFLR